MAEERGGKGTVLVVDDDPELTALIEAALQARGFTTSAEQSAEEAFRRLGDDPPDALVTDLNMPGMHGLELCERIAANQPDLPILVVTAQADLETAIAAMRVGADDFITKPLNMQLLVHRVERAVRSRKLAGEVVQLRAAIDRRAGFSDIIGESPAMQKVFDLLGRVLDSDSSVLITGDSGTGKEVVARALHRQGKRKDGPFVAVNCSAVPEQLLESELFGHTKGAFTDARSDKAGLFAQASGGTLFLDEIGEMPLGLQPKLLRALQERTVRPVGGDREIPFDVRLVAATNRDLESAVADGRFREDLFFRINVIHVELPPLSARGRDILLLAQRFLGDVAEAEGKEVTGISAGAAEKLLGYSWPGNVRELRNCIERAVVLARQPELTVEDLPEKIRDYRMSHVVVSAGDPTELVPMDQVERRYIAKVLEAVAGNKTLAAKTLGFDRKTLYRKLERYKIEYREPE